MTKLGAQGQHASRIMTPRPTEELLALVEARAEQDLGSSLFSKDQERAWLASVWKDNGMGMRFLSSWMHHCLEVEETTSTVVVSMGVLCPSARKVPLIEVRLFHIIHYTMLGVHFF